MGLIYAMVFIHFTINAIDILYPVQRLVYGQMVPAGEYIGFIGMNALSLIKSIALMYMFCQLEREKETTVVRFGTSL